MLIVQKYGGTSLADNQKIFQAANRAAELARQGNRVVIVVSAQGDTTDMLLAKAEEICPSGADREKDVLISAGEQMSAALTAMALTALGMEAVSLTGAQAGIHTDGVHGNARINRIDPDRILRELENGKIVVVAGFQGADDRGDITTLGRGGSDTTAVALAAALHADCCRLYKDVDGVYDRDPGKYPDAIRYPKISWKDMLALCRDGAQVLSARSVALAAERKLTLHVLPALSDGPGTIVGED